MKIDELAVPGAFVATPVRHGDARGFFCETFNVAVWAEAGVDHAFVQDNQAVSSRAGVVRGLHLQAPPHAQAKLVRVGRGRIRDVVVDVRRGSPAYGRAAWVDLDADTGNQLYAPAGVLHGYATLTDDVEVLYKTSNFYAPEAEAGVRWDDPDLAIDWGLGAASAVVSPKDAALGRFAAFTSPFEGS